MRIKRIVIAVTWSLVLLAFLLTGGSKVWAESISVAEYRLRIQESLAHLQEGEGQIGPEEISWFSDSFPPDLVVQDPGGERFLVDRKDFFRWAKDAEVARRAGSVSLLTTRLCCRRFRGGPRKRLRKRPVGMSTEPFWMRYIVARSSST